jgi:hypothetical protein
VGQFSIENPGQFRVEINNADLDAGRLPDLKSLRALFSPDAGAVPDIVVSYAPLSAYEELARVDQGEVA